MSSRNRNRNRNGKSGDQRSQNGQKRQNGSNGGRKGGKRKSKNRSQNKKGSNKAQKFDPVAFWGNAESLPGPQGYVVDNDDTTAIVRSLGRPPIAGSEVAAEHHFALIYENSANLARAIAVACGLDQPVAEGDSNPSTEPEPAAATETATEA